MSDRFKFDMSKDKKLREKIMLYFRTELELDFGDLKAGLILDFIKDEIGHEFYNEGVEESLKYMSEKVDDLHALTIHKR